MKEHYIKAVLEMVHEGKDPAEVLQKLREVLDRRGHTRLYHSVLRGVARVLEARGTKSATVVVANEAGYQKYQAAIEAALQEFGAKHSPEVIVDETIVGGYIVEAENKQLDKSYKTKLVSLYRNLTK